MTIEPGTPVWVDLGSNDLEAAQQFYRELFGWSFTDTGPQFGHYQMVTLGEGGESVGGAATNMHEDGTPDPEQPTWFTVYLKTEDIEATVAQVEAHGGGVFFPPMAIGDLGQMAIVSAPSGAAFGLWEPGEVTGFSASGAPGTAVWFEAMSTDIDADAAFYHAVFGWQNVPEPSAGDMGYVTNAAGADARAGLLDATGQLPEGVPSHWQVTFGVEDTDATVARLVELGGSVLMEPQDSPHGRFAVVRDAQGAPFGIISGEG